VTNVEDVFFDTMTFHRGQKKNVKDLTKYRVFQFLIVFFKLKGNNNMKYVRNTISYLQYIKIYVWRKSKINKLRKIARMRGLNHEHSFYEFGGKGEHK
jgi:hypothetical protein